MITRTEVLQAIARCEPFAGFATIDRALSPAITRGDLFALIEAAKCAKYENMHAAGNRNAKSSSELILAK